MMETLLRKNRIRPLRGKLSSFDILPKEHQDNFLIIKKVICDILGENTNVYVFGSFYWGFWDGESDYDVLLDYVYNGFKIDERFKDASKAKDILKNQYGLKVDVLIMKEKTGILIP
jgi:predicted nucleotidyltransferase